MALADDVQRICQNAIKDPLNGTTYTDYLSYFKNYSDSVANFFVPGNSSDAVKKNNKN